MNCSKASGPTPGYAGGRPCPRPLVGVLDDPGGGAESVRSRPLERALVGVLDEPGGSGSRLGGVAGIELVADGLQVGDLARGRARAAGDRDGDAGEHVVGARRPSA